MLLYRRFSGPSNAFTIYAMPQHLLLCPAVLCCAALHHSRLCCVFLLMLCSFTPCCVIHCHALAVHAILCHSLPHCSIACHAVTMCAMVWQITPCSVILRNAVSSLSSCTMLFNAVSCSAEIWAFFALLCHSPSSLSFHLNAMLCPLWVSSQFLQWCIHSCCTTFLHHNVTIS